MAITIGAMEPFVKATYTLEGDGPLALVAYEQVSRLSACISAGHYPNVQAVAKKLAGGNSSREQQLVSYAKACVEPVYSYFRSKFNNDLKVTLDAFKAARLFSPSKMYELRPTASDIDCLKSFPFLDAMIPGLKSELPNYLAAAGNVSAQVDSLTWWKIHEDDLPLWAKACKMVLLVQPFSAAAERVFSVLQGSFSRQQYRSLEDYVELSVMLQYNAHHNV